ncbi:MAG: metallophosphoesterase [Candidatus Pacebacteria bacterium]|jgi:DNA repair exonuclease SbcCD nuclease subunit|nr:metallophosphoesterase [Candidatus Paceibacterota bacterium]MDP7366444.1 metallophosphoesterase [Candidatus Paceibacterota bacterium]|tara:strand:+ start:1542 stop:2603 length:1062 start_codon:yes stop_codon:yes gene_type:complete
MLIALISDTHFQGKNDNLQYAEFQKKFYDEYFFPTLDRENVKTIIHMGDVFDRRKYSNFNTLKLAKEMFFEPVKVQGIDLHIILGNHDCYFKSTNEVNSVELTCSEYVFNLYKNTPQVVDFDGLNICFIPWLASDNKAKSIRIISKAKADIAMGHLAIVGAEMLDGVVNDSGLEKDDFKRFERVFSGHFHLQSDDGHIRYVGAPYEITWADWQTKKGFHIFDTDTREFKFYENPYKLFQKIYYDDTKENVLEKDLSPYEGSYVKIVVINKSDFYTFDRFVDRCYAEGNFYELKIVEDFSDLDPDTIADTSLEEIEDTLSLLERYVDEIDSKALNKKKLHRLLKSLYVEANEVE